MGLKVTVPGMQELRKVTFALVPLLESISTSNNATRACDIVDRLVEAWNGHELDGRNAIYVMCQDLCETLLVALSEKNSVPQCCHVVCKLIMNSDHGLRVFMEAGLGTVLRDLLGDRTLRECYEAFRYLCMVSGIVINRVKDASPLKQLCPSIVEGLNFHIHNRRIVTEGVFTLHNMASLGEEERIFLGNCGACDTIVCALWYADENSTAWLLKLTYMIGLRCSANLLRLSFSSICAAVIHATKLHMSNPKVAQIACYAIRTIATVGTNARDLTLYGAPGVLLGALELHADTEYVVDAVLLALDLFPDALGDPSTEKVVRGVMMRYPGLASGG